MTASGSPYVVPRFNPSGGGRAVPLADASSGQVATERTSRASNSACGRAAGPPLPWFSGGWTAGRGARRPRGGPGQSSWPVGSGGPAALPGATLIADRTAHPVRRPAARTRALGSPLRLGSLHRLAYGSDPESGVEGVELRAVVRHRPRPTCQAAKPAPGQPSRTGALAPWTWENCHHHKGLDSVPPRRGAGPLRHSLGHLGQVAGDRVTFHLEVDQGVDHLGVVVEALEQVGDALRSGSTSVSGPASGSYRSAGPTSWTAP